VKDRFSLNEKQVSESPHKSSLLFFKKKKTAIQIFYTVELKAEASVLLHYRWANVKCEEVPNHISIVIF
jgi:hypothetical protein